MKYPIKLAAVIMTMAIAFAPKAHARDIFDSTSPDQSISAALEGKHKFIVMSTRRNAQGEIVFYPSERNEIAEDDHLEVPETASGTMMGVSSSVGSLLQ